MKIEIDRAAEVVKNGGVILYPTDTIWGIGCDPNNEEAIQKVMAIKKRADNKSFLILVNSERLLSRYVKEIPEVCYDLLDCASAPLTIVYPNGQHLSKRIMGVDLSIGIRLTDYAFCSQLINRLKHGIVSTSANVSGQKSPSSFQDISKEIIEAVDYVVNLPKEANAPQASQIIKISAKSEIEIIRK